MLDATLIFVGGMTFGQGAPTIYLFSRMQITSAVKLGLSLALLVGLEPRRDGATNTVKPALIRFAASLVDVKRRDREIFRILTVLGFVQIIVTRLSSRFSSTTGKAPRAF